MSASVTQSRSSFHCAVKLTLKGSSFSLGNDSLFRSSLIDSAVILYYMKGGGGVGANDDDTADECSVSSLQLS